MSARRRKQGYQTHYAEEAEKEAEQISWSKPPYSKEGVKASRQKSLREKRTTKGRARHARKTDEE